MSAATLAEVLREGRGRLQHAGAQAAALEAELLLAAVSGQSRSALFAWPERRLDAPQHRAYTELLARRERGEPIAYLLGRRAFWTLELAVDARVLIPRPETELLVETALQHLPAEQPLCVADLGTGSTAVAAALARERPRWRLLGIERSAAALAVAAGNRRALGLSELALIRASWLDAVAPRALDAIVANPPYVRDSDPHLSQGDLRFEPAGALRGGSDGLEAIRAILAAAPGCLRRPGLIALEHGWDQGAAVRALLAAHGFDGICTERDLAGHERVSWGRLEADGA